MNDIHRRVFTFYLMEQDRLALDPAQRREMQAHLSACPVCRGDLKLYQVVKAHTGQQAIADRRRQAVPPRIDMQKVLKKAQDRARLGRVALPLQAALWIGLALLVLVLVQWIITNLHPTPAGVTPGGLTPTEAAPTPQVFDTPAEQILGGSFITASGREGYDYFGGSIGSDGDVIVTGAPLWNSSQVAAGRAYIFRRSAEGDWRSGAVLTASDREDDQPPHRTGLVTLYELTGEQWEQVFQTPPQEAFAPAVGFVSWEAHPFGIQVSLGGEQGQASWLVVGKPGYTPLESSYGGKAGLEPVPGSVVLYERGERGWVAQAELRLAPGELAPGALPFFSTDPAEAFFGSSVDIEGDRLAVIAACANTVDVFEHEGQDWIYRLRISPGRDILIDDYQSRILVINGNSLFLGSPAELGDGGIFLFDLTP